jgi:hypothetical protein
MNYTIVIAKIPFIENLDKAKFRPVLYLAQSSKKHETSIVAYITSNTENQEEFDVCVEGQSLNLIARSIIKISKIFTIPNSNIAYKLADIECDSTLEKNIQESLKKIFKL